ASPSSWRRAAISRWSSRPSRRGRRRGRTGPAGVRWCACRRCPCPDTPASGSACPPAGCAPRWPGITPTWCIWPARSSSGPAAARLPVIAVSQPAVPAYARLYGTGPAGQAASWRRLRKIHNAAARTLAPSTATAADLQSHGIRRVWLWGRGVDTVRFDPARRSAPLRRALAPGGEVLAGYVGRLAAEKRVDLLAGVAALPGARLVIVGSGPAEAAARRAMPAPVSLGQGRGAALASLYASLDVFVHSGPHETFGQTLQEAAASGLPVVAPAAGGPLDLVDQGVTGFLVPPGDCGALAAAFARLAADPALRAAQGLAAREKVLGRGWPVLCEELIGHCHALLEAASAPAAGVPAGPRS